MTKLRTITTPSGARMTVADEHADRFTALLSDLEAAGYPVKSGESGGYNYRNIAGTNTLSRHAHGAAIDVNWNDNARGTKGNIEPELARALSTKHGLVWGGDWKNPDPMHFEVPGQPGHTYGDGHNHGTEPATASPASEAPQVAAAPQTPASAPPAGILGPMLAELGIAAPQQPETAEQPEDVRLPASPDLQISYPKLRRVAMPKQALARAAMMRGRVAT